ncbi:MAG TPA: glycoside hydrolase family 3 N-terminal domain-containing protein [Rectinemataceae bacterium]|nr:glycoside hydrolase family 3 N-terminal domain-containing protein [Rectinemataceae bacterium]
MRSSRRLAVLLVCGIVTLPLFPFDRGIEARARLLVVKMSLEEKAGQTLLVGVGGSGSAPRASLAMVRDTGVGGILLFGFNIPADPLSLCPALVQFQEAATTSGATLPLLVAIDHEGGSVFRFKGGITRPPSPLATADRGEAYARLLGQREGLELGDLGINMVLGPIVEALTGANSAFLGNRSFGSDPHRVDAIASAYIKGLAAGGAVAVAKHFPADGPADPHRSLPCLSASRKELVDLYLARFASAIGAGAPVVMVSHIVVEAIDPDEPATLSARVIGLLRTDLGFHGVVLTDDLYMKALGMSPRRSAPRAIAAGADLLMLSSEEAALPVRGALVEAVRSGFLPESRLDEAVVSVVALKLSKGLEPARMPADRRASFAARVVESTRLLAPFGVASP